MKKEKSYFLQPSNFSFGMPWHSISGGLADYDAWL